jgi:MFS family permease
VDAPAEIERQHYNVTLGALVVAGIAFALQQTLVIPALPALREDLNTSTAWVTWLLTAFLLSASVLTPLLGKLGDQYGKERLLVISLGIFLIGSIGGIFAWNIGSLIVCRVIQGPAARSSRSASRSSTTSSPPNGGGRRSASSRRSSRSAARPGSCSRA